MSGYKRVNFYELCRLCATNQQKEKTHIFQEEGRKIQLQNKIQSCLSLKVCENDFLPKVVCSQCLRTLEECYTFRNECVTSETMLSSYFNNFRYTEDFKKSGKVYIKDTTPKPPPPSESAATVANNLSSNGNVVANAGYEVLPKCQEQFYAVQVPSQLINEPKALSKCDVQQPKLPNSNSVAGYNLNALNFAALKGIVQNMPKGESVSNIAVNANGEIINITPLLDLESILINSSSQKPPAKHALNVAKTLPKKTKSDVVIAGSRSESVVIDGSVIQIDLNQTSNNEVKYEKLPHIKSAHNNKYTYTIKIEDGPSKCSGINQGVLVNQVPNVTLPISSNQATFNQSSYTTSQHNVGGGVTSALNIDSPISNWSFAPNNINLSTNVTTTTSNISVASSMPVVSNVVASASNMAAVSNINMAAVCNIPSTPNLTAPSATNLSPDSHLNIVSTSMSVNPSLGQVNTNIVSNSGLNFTCAASASGAPWNVSSSSASNLVAVANVNTSSGLSGGTVLTSSAADLNSSNAFHPHVDSVHQNYHIGPNLKSVTNLYAKKCRGSNSTGTSAVSNLHVQAKQEQGGQSKLFPCDSCQKVFKRREHLYQHIKLHTGYRPFVCENCNKSFMRKEHLMRHMTSHSGLKNYTCDLCSKSFSRNDNLLKHKKTHDKQTSFTCEICQKQFVMKHYYLAHKLTHDNDKCTVPLWNILKT